MSGRSGTRGAGVRRRWTSRRRADAVGAVIAVLASFPTPAAAWPALDHSVPDEVARFYDPSVLRSIQLTMLPSDWDVIRRDTSYSIQVPATLTIDGTTLPSQVTVRRKSGFALTGINLPSRVALKVYLDTFDDDQGFMGVNKLSLEGSTFNPILEGISWWLHQSAATAGLYGAGYDPALAAWTTVGVNGRNLGLYLNVEDRGKRFLKNRDTYVSGQTWLFKRSTVEMEVDVGSGTSPQNGVLCFAPFGDPRSLCAAPSDDASVMSMLSSHVDVSAMVTMWAVDAFMCNWDSMLGNGNNHFWADFTYAGAPLRRYYPWDLDRSWERMRCSVFAVDSTADPRRIRQSPAEILLLNNPAIRTEYRRVWTALLAGPLSVASLSTLISDLRPVLSAAMLADPYATRLYGVPRRSPSQHLNQLLSMLLQRRTAAVSQLNANLPAPRAG